MNRIMVVYTPRKGNVTSNLQIYNDIKGYTCEKLGHTFFGRDADIMLDYFQKSKIRENDTIMNYGVIIREDEENEK